MNKLRPGNTQCLLGGKGANPFLTSVSVELEITIRSGDFFVYVDGGFRYIGELYRKLPPGYVKPRPGEQLKNVIKVAGNVQAAKLIHQEYPSYPLAQKAQHQEGTVVLHATTAKDGSVQNLAVVEGTCAFSRSALEAVKGWRYTPTLLNGDPVEVDTTISVIFTLSRK